MSEPTHDRGPFEPHVRCWCTDCEQKFSDQADPQYDELIALRRQPEAARPKTSQELLIDELRAELLAEKDRFDAEWMKWKRENAELSGMVDRATTLVEEGSAALRACAEERDALDLAGSICCGIAWDAAASQAFAERYVICAHCRAQPFRAGAEMLAHLEECSAHPIAVAVKAEREACAYVATDYLAGVVSSRRENRTVRGIGHLDGEGAAAQWIAAAIRERGGK